MTLLLSCGVLVSLCLSSCSNGTSTSTDESSYTKVGQTSTVAEPATYYEINAVEPQITFRGIPIEGSESAIIDSLKNRGIEVKPGNYNLKLFYETISGNHIFNDVAGMKYYSCILPKDDEASSIGLAFFNNELCQVQVKLKEMIGIEDVTHALENKYSINITCHKSGELYSMSRGNTKVAISGYGYAMELDYYNVSVQSKFKSAQDNKRANDAKNTVDAL